MTLNGLWIFEVPPLIMRNPGKVEWFLNPVRSGDVEASVLLIPRSKYRRFVLVLNEGRVCKGVLSRDG